MIRIYRYIISFLFTLILLSDALIAQEQATEEIPDTVTVPLKIRTGVEVSGPVIYLTGKKILNAEGYVSVDLNEKLGVYFGTGYSDYKYSQYNYDYLNKGIFFRTGIDINFLKPQVVMGKYWAGMGIRYGISFFTSETSTLTHENYWGKTITSLSPETGMGHFLELSPGFRAELFNNFSIGWSLSLRRLLYPGTKKDIRPLYIPGFGSAGESFSAGIGYFITWNIPFKKIRVVIKPEEPEEPLEEDELSPDTGVETESQSLGGRRPAIQPRIR